MRVYLVRHGEARTEAKDSARPLSNRGCEQVERVARHAAALGLRLAAIRHSGLLRAQQTAEILAQHLSPSPGVLEMNGLRPGDDPDMARAAIEAPGDPMMLVGHLPHLSRLASLLLVGDAGKEIVRFSEAALVCLGRAEGTWHLHWMLTPELAQASRSP